jgi:hypothetical protein
MKLLLVVAVKSAPSVGKAIAQPHWRLLAAV